MFVLSLYRPVTGPSVWPSTNYILSILCFAMILISPFATHLTLWELVLMQICLSSIFNAYPVTETFLPSYTVWCASWGFDVSSSRRKQNQRHGQTDSEDSAGVSWWWHDGTPYPGSVTDRSFPALRHGCDLHVSGYPLPLNYWSRLLLVNIRMTSTFIWLQG